MLIVHMMKKDGDNLRNRSLRRYGAVLAACTMESRQVAFHFAPEPLRLRSNVINQSFLRGRSDTLDLRLYGVHLQSPGSSS